MNAVGIYPLIPFEQSEENAGGGDSTNTENVSEQKI